MTFSTLTQKRREGVCCALVFWTERESVGLAWWGVQTSELHSGLEGGAGGSVCVFAHESCNRLTLLSRRDSRLFQSAIPHLSRIEGGIQTVLSLRSSRLCDHSASALHAPDPVAPLPSPPATHLSSQHSPYHAHPPPFTLLSQTSVI